MKREKEAHLDCCVQNDKLRDEIDFLIQELDLERCKHGCINGRIFHSISGIPPAKLNWTPCPYHKHLIED